MHFELLGKEILVVRKALKFKSQSLDLETKIGSEFSTGEMKILNNRTHHAIQVLGDHLIQTGDANCVIQES